MIAIKNAVMPVSCNTCPLSNYYSANGEIICRVDGKVLAQDYKPIPWAGRPSWCPLIDLTQYEDDGK